MKKPVSFLRADPNQPRKVFDESELRQLGASMKENGQLQPVGAMPDGLILWGERRWRAAILAGIEEIDVTIIDKPFSDTQKHVSRLVENIHRTDLADAEVYRTVKELQTLNPTWLKRDFAAHLHKDASMITRIFAVDDLIPEARAVFLSGAFGFSVAYPTADYVSARLGDETIVVRSGGVSRGRTRQTSDYGNNGSSSYSVNSSENWQQSARRLLKPEEVLGLSERIAITFTPGVPPIWTTLVRYYEKGFHEDSQPGLRAKVYALSALMFAGAVMMVLSGLGVNIHHYFAR